MRIIEQIRSIFGQKRPKIDPNGLKSYKLRDQHGTFPLCVEAVQVQWATWSAVCDMCHITEENDAYMTDKYHETCGEDGPYVRFYLKGNIVSHGDFIFRRLENIRNLDGTPVNRKSATWTMEPERFRELYERWDDPLKDINRS